MSKKSFKELVNGDKPVLIDFYADWCGPCKTYGPIIQEVKDAVGDDAIVLKIDVDKNQALSSKLQVKSIPTTVIYKSGSIVYRAPGVQTKAALIEELEKLG